jgi:hypothetical protein
MYTALSHPLEYIRDEDDAVDVGREAINVAVGNGSGVKVAVTTGCSVGACDCSAMLVNATSVLITDKTSSGDDVDVTSPPQAFNNRDSIVVMMNCFAFIDEYTLLTFLLQQFDYRVK